MADGIYFFRKDIRRQEQTPEFRQLFSYDGSLMDKDINKPIGLLRFSEVTVAPNSQFSFLFEQDASLLVLPLVGEITIIDNKLETTITTGEYKKVYSSESNKPILFKNISKNEHNSLLMIELVDTQTKLPYRNKGNFEIVKDTFQPIIFSENERFKIHIGSFGNRIEKEFILASVGTCFVFVIHGIVEVENRLLEAGDSMMMLDCDQVGIESFSKDGIVLLLEEAT